MGELKEGWRESDVAWERKVRREGEQLREEIRWLREAVGEAGARRKSKRGRRHEEEVVSTSEGEPIRS